MKKRRRLCITQGEKENGTIRVSRPRGQMRENETARLRSRVRQSRTKQDRPGLISLPHTGELGESEREREKFQAAAAAVM